MEHAHSSPGDVNLVSPVWYSDGNIILETGGVAFKTYGGLLSALSSPLAHIVDYADLCCATNDCPRSDLTSDVTAFELETFLLAIHNIQYYDTYVRDDFDRLVAILHVSTLYALPYLRTRALADLSTFLPTTLAQYDALDPESRPTFSQCLSFISKSDCTRASVLLPAAMYFCCVAGTLAIMRADPETLSRDDQEKLILGLESLRRYQRTATYGWTLTIQLGSCDDPTGCLCARIHATNIMEEYHGLDCRALDLLRPNDIELCDSCWHSAESGNMRGRELVWGALPDIFELPPWEELRTDFE